MNNQTIRTQSIGPFFCPGTYQDSPERQAGERERDTKKEKRDVRRRERGRERTQTGERNIGH